VLRALFTPTEDAEDFKSIHETSSEKEDSDILELAIEAIILEVAELERQRKKPARSSNILTRE